MSAWLVAFIGAVYAYIAVEQFCRDHPAMGIMYAGYAFSNVGLWWLTK